MLERLGDINWANYNHAYGPADDVPGLIRGLLSESSEERENIWYELYGSLWHQGTIYEATVHAVPFFIELLQDKHTPDKFKILSYLGSLAEGSSYIDVHKSLSVLDFSDEDLSVNLQKELDWVSRTRAEILKGKQIYLDLLKGGETETSGLAAYLISRFPEYSDEFVPKLKERYEAAGSDDLLRFAIAILFQYFKESESFTADWLYSKFQIETSIPARLGLAISLAYQKKNPSNDVFMYLLESMLEGDGARDTFQALYWDIGEPEEHIISALCYTEAGAKLAVEYINSKIPQNGQYDDAFDYCYDILVYNIYDKPVERQRGKYERLALSS